MSSQKVTHTWSHKDIVPLEPQPPLHRWVYKPTHTSSRSRIHAHMLILYKRLPTRQHTYPTHTAVIPLLISLFPRLSGLVQVGRLRSGGSLNLSTLLTIIVWQQTYGVKHDFTSSQNVSVELDWSRLAQRTPKWVKKKLQSQTDVTLDWTQIAIRNGDSSGDGVMDLQAFGECKNYEQLIAFLNKY